MKLIQFIGVSPDELKNEIVEELFTKLKSQKALNDEGERKKFVTRKEAAKLLCVTIVTLHNWEKKGILQPHRIGNLIRYNLAEVEEALKKINRSNK